MPIPVTCAKCGNTIQAPNHVAGRTLRCFKCLTPFTVPKAAPMGQWAPAPVATMPDSPLAASAAPKPPATPMPAAAQEFELPEEPLLLEPEPGSAPPPSGGDELTPLEEIEMMEEPKSDGEDLPSTEDIAWEEDKPAAKPKKAAAPAGDGASLLDACALMQEDAYLLKHNFSLFGYKFSLLRPGSKDVLAVGRQRFSIMRMLPVVGSFVARVIEFREGDQGPVVFSMRIRKPILSFTQRFEVFDDQAQLLGYFQQKLFANILTGGGFWVYDAQGQQVAETKNKGLFSMNARCGFMSTDGRELGHIVDEATDTMKKKGFAVVFIPGWVLKVADEIQDQPRIKLLLVAAGLAMEIRNSESKKAGP